MPARTTISADEHLGPDKDTGSLEPGTVADVIAVGENPMKDVTELGRVGIVMRSGAVAKTAVGRTAARAPIR